MPHIALAFRNLHCFIWLPSFVIFDTLGESETQALFGDDYSPLPHWNALVFNLDF